MAKKKKKSVKKKKAAKKVVTKKKAAKKKAASKPKPRLVSPPRLDPLKTVAQPSTSPAQRAIVKTPTGVVRVSNEFVCEKCKEIRYKNNLTVKTETGHICGGCANA